MIKFVVAAILSFSTLALGEDSRVVQVFEPNGNATAFAFIAPSKKTYLMTNAHVCKGLKFLLSAYNGLYEVNLIEKIYDKEDLCVISTLRRTGFSIADEYSKEQLITIIGYPNSKRAVLRGTLDSFFSGSAHWGPAFFAQLPCAPGSSGSPIIDDSGTVIGVVNGVPVDKKAVGCWAVPLSYVKDFVKDF